MDEIELNALRSGHVRTRLRNELTHFTNVSILPGPVKDWLELVVASLKDGDIPRCETLAQEALKDLTIDHYFVPLHRKLVELLLPPTGVPSHTDQIEWISRELIAELILSGRSAAAVAKIPSQLWDGFAVTDDTVTTNFPAATQSAPFKSKGKLNHLDFCAALTKEISALTLSDRLMAIERVFTTPNRQMQVILPIIGLRGSKSRTIGNVRFYCPRSEPIVKGDRMRSEIFNSAESARMNAAVTVCAKDEDSALAKARSTIESALDLLSFFHSKEQSLTVDPSGSIILDVSAGTTAFRRSWDTRSPDFAWVQAFDSDQPLSKSAQALLDSAVSLIGRREELSPIQAQMVTVLHWFRKARDEAHEEDRLVDIWIALEKLLSARDTKSDEASKRVFSLVPNCLVARKKYQVGWNAFHYLRALTNFEGGAPTIQLPREVLEAGQLSYLPGQQIHLRRFIDTIPNILRHVDRSVVVQRLRVAYRFYNDNRFAHQMLTTYLDTIRSDLFWIQRYRNRIIHSGHFDSISLPILAKIADSYLSQMIESSIAVAAESLLPNTFEWATQESNSLLRRMEQLEQDKPVFPWWEPEA